LTNINPSLRMFLAGSETEIPLSYVKFSLRKGKQKAKLIGPVDKRHILISLNGSKVVVSAREWGIIVK